MKKTKIMKKTKQIKNGCILCGKPFKKNKAGIRVPHRHVISICNSKKDK